MNLFNKFLVAVFMSAALLPPGMTQAMDIIRFDQMANQDRQDFLDSLSGDAEAVLNQEGRSDDAAKVFHLFNDISPGSNLPLGEAELNLNLDSARVRDTKKHIQNPAAPRADIHQF